MRWRKLTVDEIVSCIEEPEAQEELPLGEVYSWKRIRDEWVRVVHVEESDAIAVVTVICPARSPERGEG